MWKEVRESEVLIACCVDIYLSPLISAKPLISTFHLNLIFPSPEPVILLSQRTSRLLSYLLALDPEPQQVSKKYMRWASFQSPLHPLGLCVVHSIKLGPSIIRSISLLSGLFSHFWSFQIYTFFFIIHLLGIELLEGGGVTSRFNWKPCNISREKIS